MSDYVNPEVLAETAWMAEHVDDPGVRLVECDEDVDLYGRGHIPGAVNVPWGRAINTDWTFKSAAEIRWLYDGAGLTPDKDIIVYCRIGERSAVTWFVLHELMGYRRVCNYDGSWTEWGNSVGVPVANPSVGTATGERAGEGVFPRPAIH